jgi:hypothetical protein
MKQHETAETLNNFSLALSVAFAQLQRASFPFVVTVRQHRMDLHEILCQDL